VEKVLESFFLPTVEVAIRNPGFVRLMGQMLAEGMMPRIVEKHFQATGLRFVGALRRAVPELPQEELMWRIHFMVGAMAHTMCRAPIFPELAGDVANMEPRLKRLVTFLAAGFRAAATGSRRSRCDRFGFYCAWRCRGAG
jgi:hypothetical protein